MAKTRTATAYGGTLKLKLYERKKTGKLVPCPGEAHSNPHIDNCMLCMPRWGEIEERAPIDFGEARLLGQAVPFSGMSHQEHDVAQALTKSDGALQLMVEEKLRGGNLASYYVLAWKELL
jgi:hypothetical protein